MRQMQPPNRTLPKHNKNVADRIYLDHASTTPLLPTVREAMLPYLAEGYGNPSRQHAEGRFARQAIDQAREVVSQKLGCLFAEAIFTASATEALNLAMIGLALGNEDPSRNRVLMGAAEHHAVLHVKPMLQRLGYEVEVIPCDDVGRIDTEWLAETLDDRVLAVAAMLANNELGTTQDIASIAEIVHVKGALLVCDAVQSFGLPWTVNDLDADLIAICAHKIHGPKGAGALYIRAGTKLKPLIAGGGQERELRAGTEDVAAIAGFGAAVQVMNRDVEWFDRKRAARDAFLAVLEGSGWIPSVMDCEKILPGHAHGRFPGANAESMLILLDRMGVSAGAGAACSSGSLEPSHVMLACGYSETEAREGLRFTFSGTTTVEEAKEAARRVGEAATRFQGSGATATR